MSCQVKICGLSEESTLQAAIDAGADFIGFVHFKKSPRHVELARAAELKKLIPAHIKSVVVTVDPDNTLIRDIVHTVNPDYIQLHGSETMVRMAEIHALHPKLKIIKAIPVATSADLEKIPQMRLISSIYMFDAKPPKGADLPGGNGVSFDWNILKDYRDPNPWMLSGGLTPENVQAAIRASGAKIVDVSSGVESAPGVKDAGKIKAFIKAANNR